MIVPTYRPTGSPLHRARATIAIAFLAVPCAVAALYEHPLILVLALAAEVGIALAAGLRAELWSGVRLAAPLALLVLVVNPLVSREGLTVLVVGPTVPVLGRLDVTLEALVYGAIAALRVLIVVLAFAIYSAATDPDELLRLARRLSFRSSLVASLATRMVPVLARDAQRLADAYGLRAEAPPAATGAMPRLRRGAVLTRALAAGALERSVEVAAALEVRGYANAPPRGRGRWRAPWSRDERAFALAGGAALAGVIAARAAGVAAFEPYPSVAAQLGVAELVLGLAVPVLALAPFALARSRGDRA